MSGPTELTIRLRGFLSTLQSGGSIDVQHLRAIDKTLNSWLVPEHDPGGNPFTWAQKFGLSDQRVQAIADHVIAAAEMRDRRVQGMHLRRALELAELSVPKGE